MIRSIYALMAVPAATALLLLAVGTGVGNLRAAFSARDSAFKFAKAHQRRSMPRVPHRSADHIVLGVADSVGAFVLAGHVDNQGVPAPVLTGDSTLCSSERFFGRFPLDVPLRGLSSSGRAVTVRLGQNDDADRFFMGPSFRSQVDPPSAIREGPVLLWTGALRVEGVPVRTASVEPDVDSLLRARVLHLWSRALPLRELPRRESTRPSFLGTEVLQIMSGGNLILVRYRLGIQWNPNYLDDRASVLFILDGRTMRVVYETFGHPEWGLANHAMILGVRPFGFFRLAGRDDVYFFGEHVHGWEHFGYAVYEARTGNTALETC